MQGRDLLNSPFEQLPDNSKSTLQNVFEKSTIPPPGHGTLRRWSTCSGDIVVGADGVHSSVKSLMSQHIEKSKLG